MNQFSLVQAVDRFSQGVVIAVAPAADRRFDARFGQAFAVANADVLGPSVRMVYQGCVFHTKLDSDFAPSWTGISREGGHGFHGKLDSDFTRSWTVAA